MTQPPPIKPGKWPENVARVFAAWFMGLHQELENERQQSPEEERSQPANERTEHDCQ